MHRLSAEQKEDFPGCKEEKGEKYASILAYLGKERGRAVWERDHSAWCDCLELLVPGCATRAGGLLARLLASRGQEEVRGLEPASSLAGVTSTLATLRSRKPRPSLKHPDAFRRGAERGALTY